MRRPAFPLAVAALTAILAGACSGPVELEEPPVDAATAKVCAAVMADLPETVLGETSRAVRPGTRAAAWGDPAITLRCGVAKPPTLTPSSQCFAVNGVDWYAEEGQGGYLFTTIGRPVFIEVTVPSEYAPEANALVDVAHTVDAHVPLERPCA